MKSLRILAYIFALYLPVQIALSPLPDIDLASARVFIILHFLLWLFLSVAQKKVRIPLTTQSALLVSLCFLWVLSLVWTPHAERALRPLLFLLSIVPLFFIVTTIFKTHTQVRKLISFLVYGGALAATVALLQFSLQFAVGLDPTLDLWNSTITPWTLGTAFSQLVGAYPSWLVNIGGITVMRAFGTFPDPHMFALYVELLLPFAIALGLSPCAKKQNIYHRNNIFLGISLLMLLALLLTFSRGAYLALFLGGILFLGSYAIKKKKTIVDYITNKPLKSLMFIVVTIIIVGAIMTNPFIQTRFIDGFDLTEGSNEERMLNWTQAVEIIATHPLTGVGLGNYASTVDPTAPERSPIYAHNMFLDIAATTGMISLLLWLMLFTVSMIAFKQKGQTIAPLYHAGVWSLLLFLIHSLVETGLFSVRVFPLLITIIAISSILIVKRNKHQAVRIE